MDQLKKNLFWIILAVVVLGAVAGWYFLTPDVEAARTAAVSTADAVSKAANASNNPGAIKNPAYVSAAATYTKELDAEKTALIKRWELQHIDLKFTDIPGKDKPIEFDSFISKLREGLLVKMKAANVQPPANFDVITFSDSGADDRSAEIKRHRDYRLRYMAVLDEVVDALCTKPGSLNVAAFETDPNKPEPTQATPAGPTALLRFVFHMPEETAKLSALDFDKALTLANRKKDSAKRDAAGFTGPDAPLSVSSVEVEFVSHLSAVPPVIRKIESSSRYFGIITKTDFERAAPIFPNTKDVKDNKDPLYKAGYLAGQNTHYGEGSVRVLMAMDILEFDKKKAEAFETAPKPATVIKKTH